MDHLPDNEVKRLLQHGQRYVAFIDFLGYAAGILADKRITEEARFRRLHSAFEAIIASVETALSDASERPEAICFSDSIYLASRDLRSLLACVRSIYATAYLFQESTYGTHDDNWVPYLRGAMSQGWAVSFYDPTLRGSARVPSEAFRNPVGKSVASAYMLSEGLSLPGMRFYVENALLRELKLQHEYAPNEHYKADGLRFFPVKLPIISLRLRQAASNALNAIRVPVPRQPAIPSELLELDWFEQVIQATVSPLAPLRSSKRQFTRSGTAHLIATAELMKKSAMLSAREQPILEVKKELASEAQRTLCELKHPKTCAWVHGRSAS